MQEEKNKTLVASANATSQDDVQGKKQTVQEQIEAFEQRKAKQQSILNDNPFVAIKDKPSYQAAKKAKNALVKARTSVTEDAKIIKRSIDSLKAVVTEKANQLLAITADAEAKQKAEVERFEGIQKAAETKKLLEEQKRKQGHVQKLNSKKDELQTLILNATIDNFDYSGVSAGLTDFFANNDLEEYSETAQVTLKPLLEKYKARYAELLELQRAKKVPLQQPVKVEMPKPKSMGSAGPGIGVAPKQESLKPNTQNTAFKQGAAQSSTNTQAEPVVGKKVYSRADVANILATCKRHYFEGLKGIDCQDEKTLAIVKEFAVSIKQLVTRFETKINNI